MKDLAVVAVVSVVIGIFLWALLMVVDAGQRWECKKIHQETGYETRYPDHLTIDLGCMVKTKSGWVPTKDWRPE